MVPSPGLRDVVGAVCLVLSLQSTLGVEAPDWRGDEHRAGSWLLGHPQALELDCASLLQTQVQVQSPNDRSALPGGPASVADDRFRVTLEKATHMDKASNEPWFYNAAIDADDLGRIHDRGQIWSDQFELYDNELPMVPKDIEGYPHNYTVGFVKDDPGNPGAVFEKVPKEEGSKDFALKTIFGTYVSREDGGRIVAWQREPSNVSWWRIHPHPAVPDRGDCLQPAFAPQFCIGVRNQAGEMATVYPSATKISTVMLVTETEGHISFETSWGVVTAARHPYMAWEWRRAMQPVYGYEIQQLMMPEIVKTEGETRALWLGWQEGLVGGVVLGGFVMLIVYNLCFFFSSTTSSAPARLPYFDVSRFALETLVVHQHLGFIGCHYNGFSLWMSAFRMPSFMFITGVMGSSMNYESFSKLVCATVGTTCLMYIVRVTEYLVIQGPVEASKKILPYPDFSATMGDTWFLMALVFCRCFVTPIFYAARKLYVRPVVALFIVKTASFILMAVSGMWLIPVFGSYNWANSLAFAPYFALGLLYSPKEWDAIFRRREVQIGCVSYVVLWYLGTLVQPFLFWNRLYCLPGLQPEGCISHFDPAQMLPGITVERFLLDWALYILRGTLTVSVVGTFFTVALLVQPRAPQVIEYCAGWGSRTLFTYILHLHLFFLMQRLGNVNTLFTDHMSRTAHLLTSLVLPPLINITFASRGTERLLKWLLMPFWMKDIFENHLLVRASVKPTAPAPQAQAAPPEAKKEPQDLIEIEKQLAGGDPKVAADVVAAASLYLEQKREEKAEFDGRPHKI